MDIHFVPGVDPWQRKGLQNSSPKHHQALSDIKPLINRFQKGWILFTSWISIEGVRSFSRVVSKITYSKVEDVIKHGDKFFTDVFHSNRSIDLRFQAICRSLDGIQSGGSF